MIRRIPALFNDKHFIITCHYMVLSASGRKSWRGKLWRLTFLPNALLLIPHDMWNQHDASLMLIPRSSNIAEGWHHGFHSMLSCSNPTLWKFLDALKSEQALTDQKLARRKLRQLPEPRAPKWINYDQRLQKIVDDFESYTHVLDYLEAVGNMTMLK